MDCPLLGVVLNRIESSRARGYYSKSYYSKGYSKYYTSSEASSSVQGSKARRHSSPEGKDRVSLKKETKPEGSAGAAGNSAGSAADASAGGNAQ